MLGAFGLPVTNFAVVASENALVPVQTHLPLVVGKAVAPTIMSQKNVLSKNAQVRTCVLQSCHLYVRLSIRLSVCLSVCFTVYFLLFVSM